MGRPTPRCAGVMTWTRSRSSGRSNCWPSAAPRVPPPRGAGRAGPGGGRRPEPPRHDGPGTPPAAARRRPGPADQGPPDAVRPFSRGTPVGASADLGRGMLADPIGVRRAFRLGQARGLRDRYPSAVTFRFPGGTGSGNVLSIRPFRRLWIATSLSSLGDWLSLLALTAEATILAKRGVAAQASAVGAVWLSSLLPALLLGPLAGAVADRLDRRMNMIINDVLRGAVRVHPGEPGLRPGQPAHLDLRGPVPRVLRLAVLDPGQR